MQDYNVINLENLDYGAYILEYEDNYEFSENVKYAGAEFNKLHIRKVRLPEGKGNIIFLLSNTFDNCIKMINGTNFLVPPSYRRFFYPQLIATQFMGRRLKIDINKLKTQRNKLITKSTMCRPYATRTIQSKSVENIFFATSDIFEAVVPIMTRYNPRKIYQEFYPQFTSIIKGFCPEKEVTTSSKASSDNRILLIDVDGFKFDQNAPLNTNKTNPLYMIYLAFLRHKNLSELNVDMDMMICSKNLFIKFNPAKTTKDDWPIFKKALFRIMNTNLDDYTDKLSDSDKSELSLSAKDTVVDNVVNDTVELYGQLASTSTKEVLANAVETQVKKNLMDKAVISKAIRQDQKAIAAELGNKTSPKDLFKSSLIDPKKEKLVSQFAQYEPLGQDTGTVIDIEEDDEEFDRAGIDELEDEAKDEVMDVLTSDQEIVAEVLDEIQDKVAPIKNPKTAPINSARDKKLREEQKKIVVRTETIEQVLERDASNITVETSDKSAVMKTSNENMKKITFTNFDKTYIENLYTKDILACFDMLKDKSSPFYITGIDIKDTSNTMNYQETWTVHLVDEVGKKHTIKVDIPKFQNDRFMLIDGTKWIILKQNFYNPLVKDTPDTVILTTNFNKVTIDRKATKSLSTIERIFSLIKKSGDNKVFVTGDSSRSNMKYISSLEYDELSRRLFKFSSNGCEIYFSRDYIRDNLSEKVPNDIKGNEFFIGMERNTPILINEDTGRDRNGRTIADIIEANLSDEYASIYKSIKSPAQSMYAEGKLAGEMIPIIVTLMVWVGLSNTLNKMKIKWTFHPNVKKIPAQIPGMKYIKFGDGVLEYEAYTFAELILNGLSKLKPEKMKFEDFDTEIGYADYVYSQWGSYNGITQLKNFYEFLIDPITKSTCRDLMLPTEPDELLIHAVKLLADNTAVSKAFDGSYRVRSVEMIPSILYSCIAAQYKTYVSSGRRIPMTLNQRVVISKLIAEKTVEAYSTLNPVIEVSKTHTISTKGYRGSNSDHSYDEEKRSYDPSAVGKLAISTSADANVGINKQIVIEPTLSNARGYRDQVDDPESLKDVNIFSPVEMLTPGTSRNDDPIRTAIAGKQSQHVVPVADASPALVSNGYDEAVQFHLSDDFVINAEEDGQVIDVNEELGFIVVKYKSGKTKAINTRPEVVKNSGGGFYMSNQLTPTVTKVGEKFKKDEPLAYHDKYFKYSKMSGLRYSVGPIVKMAFMSSYNTYEDAGICTETLAERMKSSMVYLETGKFRRNNNILDMVKIGDHVNIGDVLIKFDTSVEDNELAKYLSKLSDENAAILEEETKNDIKTNHAGKVIDIKVYTLLDPSNLSPSLGKIVQQYFDKGNNKKEYLNQFDGNDSIMKAGYMLTDSTEPVKNRYNTIKGHKGIDVLIEIYIEHDDVMGVGDKIALYSANKQIISEVIPKGWEPYSEFEPDEEISVITSPGTIARRMTPSTIAVSAAMKCMIYLKRKIKKEIKYK